MTKGNYCAKATKHKAKAQHSIWTLVTPIIARQWRARRSGENDTRQPSHKHHLSSTNLKPFKCKSLMNEQDRCPLTQMEKDAYLKRVFPALSNCLAVVTKRWAS